MEQAPKTKLEWRQWLKRERVKLSLDDVQLKSEKLCQNLLRWLDERSFTGRLFLFCALPGEPDFGLLMNNPRWGVALPRLISKTSMEFAAYQIGDALIQTSWGLREPSLQAAVVTPTPGDVIIIPALGVTRDGHRIGFGAGFYDRYLAGLVERPVLVAAVFESAVLPSGLSWAEPHDIAVDWILSETGIFEAVRMPSF